MGLVLKDRDESEDEKRYLDSQESDTKSQAAVAAGRLYECPFSGAHSRQPVIEEDTSLRRDSRAEGWEGNRTVLLESAAAV